MRLGGKSAPLLEDGKLWRMENEDMQGFGIDFMVRWGVGISPSAMDFVYHIFVSRNFYVNIPLVSCFLHSPCHVR